MGGGKEFWFILWWSLCKRWLHQIHDFIFYFIISTSCLAKRYQEIKGNSEETWSCTRYTEWRLNFPKFMLLVSTTWCVCFLLRNNVQVIFNKSFSQHVWYSQCYLRLCCVSTFPAGFSPCLGTRYSLSLHSKRSLMGWGHVTWVAVTSRETFDSRKRALHCDNVDEHPHVQTLICGRLHQQQSS